MTRETGTAGSSAGPRCLDILTLAVVLVCGSLLAPAIFSGESQGQLLIPPDDIPAALEGLGSLDIARGFAMSPDGKRAAIGVPDPLKAKGGYVRFTAGDGEVADVAVKGHVLQLCFDPTAPFLYALAQRVGRKEVQDAFVVRIDLATKNAERLVTMPASASDLSMWTRRSALLVTSKDEVRSILVPLGRSGPFYEVPGDNRAVASLPGSDRVLVGQDLQILLIDLSDPQGPDGMPIRERLDSPAPVARMLPSPQGDAALVRLDDARVFTLRLDPMRLEDERSAERIAWLGEPVAYEPPPAAAAAVAAEVPKTVESAPAAAPEISSEPEVPREMPEPAPAPAEVVETETPAPAPAEVVEIEMPDPEPEVVESTPVAQGPATAIVERAPAAGDAAVEVSEVAEPSDDSSTVVAGPPSAESSPGAAEKPTAEEAKAASEPETSKTSVSADPSKGDVEGKLTGPARSEVVAVVLHGPNNILHEAARVRPESDGTWSALGLEPGRYRVILDGGGGRVLQTQPSFRTIEVKAGSRVTVESIHVAGAL